jgi:hypothetical protein
VARTEIKLRVYSTNPVHTHLTMFDRVDGEGDVPDTEWKMAGTLVFDTPAWEREIRIRFEAAGFEVEGSGRVRGRGAGHG